MKTIRLVRLGMENFCGCIEKTILEIRKTGLTMITGPNGSGKTTIFDSIPFTFYGETSKGLKGEDVINNKVKKNCHTFVEFYIDEIFYRVDRYVKYSKIGTTVLLRQGPDENNIIKKGHNEVKPEIERLILPQKLFFNTILFGQKVNSFFTELEDSKQKEIFRKILSLDKYLIYQKEINSRIDSLKTSIVDDRNKITVQSSLINNSLSQITMIEDNKKRYEENRLLKIKNIGIDIISLQNKLIALNKSKEEYGVDLDNDLKNVMNQIDLNNSKLQTIQAKKSEKISDLSLKENTKKNEINNSAIIKKEEARKVKEEKVSKLKENFYEQDEKQIRIKLKEINDKIHKIDNDVTYINANIENLKETKNNFIEHVINKDISICPTCNQEISSKEKENLKKHINELENRIKNLYIEQKDNNEKELKLKQEENELEKYLSTKREELQIEISKLSEIYTKQCNDVNLRLSSVLSKLSSLVEKEKNQILENYEIESKSLCSLLSQLNFTKNGIEEKISKKREIENNIIEVNHKIDLSKLELEEVKSKEFDESQLLYLKDKIKEAKNIISDLKNKIEDYDENITILEFWKEAFSSRGIPSMLIDEAIPFINRTVCEYLDNISHGRYIVSFDTISENKKGEFKDKISVNVFDTNSHANNRKQLSGGQSRIVDIATILTLFDLQSNVQGIRFNLLLFDEIFDSLDDSNINQVARLLKLISKDRSVFVISHTHIDQIESDENLNFLV